MKQNNRKIHKGSGTCPQPTTFRFDFAFENPTKKQIKKKQRRFFKEEKGESLLSKLSKSSSLMIKNSRRKKPLRWSENETNTFYKCLEFFGRDFEMITSVFQNKRKRQIIRKFHKERKRYPERVQMSLQKHDSNQIEKTYKDNTFFNDIFDKTDTSEDEPDFYECSRGFLMATPTTSLRNNAITPMPQKNSIILEGLIEEEQEFEREIDEVNNQKQFESRDVKDSLNELLHKMDTDNQEASNKKGFPFSVHPIICDETENQFRKKKNAKGNVRSFKKNVFWKSNRIEEEESEKPPPKSVKLFKFISPEVNFEQFDFQLKQQSGFDIKPLDFYLEEGDREKKKK
jgi:hypothetical protein